MEPSGSNPWLIGLLLGLIVIGYTFLVNTLPDIPADIIALMITFVVIFIIAIKVIRWAWRK